MRKTLILASMAIGTVAMAAIPVDHMSTDILQKKDLSRQSFTTGLEASASEMGKNTDREINVDPPEYGFDVVEVGNSRYDYQHNGSYNKMVAVSSDGVAHGVFMGGVNTGTLRRVQSWCVGTDLTVTGPQDVSAERTGYTSIAVTSAAPANGLGADSGVPAFHTGTASWFGVDFFGCTLAFNLVQSPTGPDILWPHVAMDYQDKVHIVSGDAGTVTEDGVWYKASTDGSSFDTDWIMLTDNSNVLSMSSAAAKNAPGAAVMFMQNAPAASATFSPDSAPQWYHDVFYYESRDAANDLYGVVDENDPVNVTKYHDAESTAPFAYGVMAYADIDAVYDMEETPNLHISWPTPISIADSMLYYDPADGTDDLYIADDFVNINLGGAIWHYNATTESYSHIAGYLTTENDWTEVDGDYETPDFPDPGVFRIAKDRVQLCVDPETGYMYAMWNVYSDDDRRAGGDDGLEMANGELFMACSADNGETWGESVNITNSQTPGCVVDECHSETFASLAEHVVDGYLHITFMLDSHAGSSIRNDDANDGSTETDNPYYYMRVPVGDVMPHAGVPWDAVDGGHVGIFPHQRQWQVGDQHPDTLQFVDGITIYNESPEEVFLTSLTLYHDPLDDFAGNDDLWYMWEVMDGDPTNPGDWIVNPENGDDWNGSIPAYSAKKIHVSVGHNGLPLREQAFRFLFSNGDVQDYRFIYFDGDFDAPHLLPAIEMDNLEGAGYSTQTLFLNGDDVERAGQPASFELMQNVPNPFNPTTQINFNLTSPAQASLKIFNLMGQEVATLVNDQLNAGPHSVTFDGSQLSSGVYFYTLEANGQRETQKMLLAK